MEPMSFTKYEGPAAVAAVATSSEASVTAAMSHAMRGWPRHFPAAGALSS
jgi:hypothetical protein